MERLDDLQPDRVPVEPRQELRQHYWAWVAIREQGNQPHPPYLFDALLLTSPATPPGGPSSLGRFGSLAPWMPLVADDVDGRSSAVLRLDMAADE